MQDCKVTTVVAERTIGIVSRYFTRSQDPEEVLRDYEQGPGNEAVKVRLDNVNLGMRITVAVCGFCEPSSKEAATSYANNEVDIRVREVEELMKALGATIGEPEAPIYQPANSTQLHEGDYVDGWGYITKEDLR